MRVNYKVITNDNCMLKTFKRISKTNEIDCFAFMIRFFFSNKIYIVRKNSKSFTKTTKMVSDVLVGFRD